MESYSLQTVIPILSDTYAVGATAYFLLSGTVIRKHHFTSPLASCACALLAFTSARHGTGWPGGLHQLSLAMLPLLARFGSGQPSFKAVNFVWILTLAQVADDVPMSAKVIDILLHACILAESLTASEWSNLRTFLASLLYFEEFGLLRVLRTRELTADDFCPLPERLRTSTICREFVINPKEHLFAMRAIVRMARSSLLPLLAIESLLRVVPIYRTIVAGYILDCVDDPAKHMWYEVYLYLTGNLLLLLVSCMETRINGLVITEKRRITRAAEFRCAQRQTKQPGSDRAAHTGYGSVDELLESMLSAWDSVSWMFSAAASLYTAYLQVGRAAAAPAIMMLVMSLIQRIIIIFRHSQAMDIYMGMSEHYSIDDIYSNIKTIKFNGWEERYLNKPKNSHRTRSVVNPGWKAYCLSHAISGAQFLYSLATELSAQLSSLITVQWHFKNGRNMSGVEMLQLIDQFSNLERSLHRTISGLRKVTNIASVNIKAEKYLFPTPMTTIEVIDTAACSGPCIELDCCSFSLSKGYKADTLRDVTLKVNAGELVSVMGSVGSGKTTLLLGMCGEVRLTAGTGSVAGRVAYVEQNPYFLDDTLRANILFGNNYEEELYRRVIDACALAEDISRWPDRDMTIISNDGGNISGGQKARVALARAIYTKADIYILDDPLSAVDPHIKRHLLDHVLLNTGILGDKLRVVSMNSDHLKPFANQNVRIENCTAVVDIQTQPRVHSVAVRCYHSDTGSDTSLNTVTGVSASPPKVMPVDSARHRDTLSGLGGIKWSNIAYLVHLFGIPVLAYSIVSAAFDPIVGYIFDSLAIDSLSGSRGAIDGRSLLRYAGGRALSNIVHTSMHRVRQFIRENVTGKHVEDRVHRMLMSGLVLAPMSLFESTDHYQTNRLFRNCNHEVANELPNILQLCVSSAVAGVLCVYRVSSRAPLLLLLAPLLAYLSDRISSLSFAVMAKSQAIELRYLSRMHDAERPLSNGQTTIRVHKVGDHFATRFSEASNDWLRINSQIQSMRDLAGTISMLVGECLSILIKSAIILQSQLTGSAITVVELKVFEGLARNLISDIKRLVAIKGRVAKMGDTVGEFRRFTGRPCEKAWAEGQRSMPLDWPSKGDIEICGYSMRYKSGHGLALRDITLSIKGGEHIGIVGRTGAGKSSLTRALFRLVEGESGSIFIDGVDISTLRADCLRPNLAIIPQDSTLFTDTVRANLDPLNQFTIEDMWAALQTTQAVEFVNPASRHQKHEHSPDETANAADEELQGSIARRLLDFVGGVPLTRHFNHFARKDWGLNMFIFPQSRSLSAGQRQQFSLSRTLIRKSKILVLDEATADVDRETDKLIHDVIHREFAGSTILTIAHRLETVMRSDRIIVMDNGCIVEFDTPASLLAKGGHFADMVALNNS